MKEKLKEYYDLIYFFIIFIAIGLSLVYGQILEANIGEFPMFMVFGGHLPLYAIILIPIVITLIYAFAIYIAYKNKLLELSRNGIIFISILVVMLIYMTFLIAFKDNSHLYNPDFTRPNVPSINDRLFSIFTFYLSMLMIFAFYFLFKATKHLKLFLEIVLIGIILFALSSVIYSLTTEIDDYIYIIKNGGFIDKDFAKDHWIKSFYGIGNVFGHTVYCGAITFLYLGYMIKKPWVGAFGLIFLPFALFSGSRASLLSLLIFYGVYLIYLDYEIYKKNKKRGKIYFCLLFSLILLFFLELFAFKNIKFGHDGKIVYLKDLIGMVFENMDETRFSVIRMVYKNANAIDFIFGLGYGLQFIVPRTYGYFYYMHNTFVEYYATGGILYLLFILFILAISVKRAFISYKRKSYIFGLFMSLVFSQLFYGMFESIPILVCDFFGAIFGMYIFIFTEINDEACFSLYKI